MPYNNQNQNLSPKPYELVTLPNVKPPRQRPKGQHIYHQNCLTGSIKLNLQVKNCGFIASGVVATGADISQQHKNIPLIKLAVTKDSLPIIPGSSFKGVLRSTFEAITASCLCKTKVKDSQIPEGYKECNNKENLCPACRIFGAMGWQGLIIFNDAMTTEIKSSIGFMPSLYSPHLDRKKYYQDNNTRGRVAGRKCYYHAVKAISKSQTSGIPVQQLANDLTFTTDLKFKNLSEAELGALVTALGVVKEHKFALKIGSGKPIGMGTMVITIDELEAMGNVSDRYLNYEVNESQTYTGDKLTQFLTKISQTALSQNLLQSQQLSQIKEVLKYPTTRLAPDGMY